MGLGRIRVQSIKNHIKDEEQVAGMLERIDSRIKKEVTELIESKLIQDRMKFSFDRIAIFDPKNRAYIKEWII